MGRELFGLQAGLRPYMFIKDAFRRRMCRIFLVTPEFPSLAQLRPFSFCAFAKNHLSQRLRSIAETTIKAQLIHWFQAIKIKIQ
jgi:hypothetical protein